jgi:hypothetical protein
VVWGGTHVSTHPEQAIGAAQPPPKRVEDPRVSSQAQWVQKRLRAVVTAISDLSEALGSGLCSEDRMLLEPDFAALRHQMQWIAFRTGLDDAARS